MTHELPALPYEKNALEPHISGRTLEFHHGKHHQTYVSTLNKLIEGTPLAEKPLVEIIKETFGSEEHKKVFNNAAQVWNHTFYWGCMSPKGGGRPTGEIARLIEQSFGSYDVFREKLEQAAASQFGSGWAWLVEDGGKLEIMKTPNADNPMCFGKKALLTIDVWEHAYYLDYQNRRPAYVSAFLDHLVDWNAVEGNLRK